MPPRSWTQRIEDMVDQTTLILRHCAGVTRDDFLANEVLQGDLLYRIGVLGEAVAGIPDEAKLHYPEVPWRDIRNMRNFLTHAYFSVELERVWELAARHVEPLQRQLRAILEAEDPGRP